MHGEAFSVAGGIYYLDGSATNEFHLGVPRDLANGTKEDREWVNANIPASADEGAEMMSPRDMRHCFWECWQRSKDRIPELTMAVDCGWPVESNFLHACIADSPFIRKYAGPYPLHEIATLAALTGLSDFPRLDSEIEHHPLHDARHSARKLFAAIKKLKSL